MISYQPRPKIPPIGFFQPISVDPKDMMTDVEFLLGILKKLNEVITQVNTNTSQIDKIAELEADVATLRQEMIVFENEINNEITARFNEIVIEINRTIATLLAQANAYTDSKFVILEEEIARIVVGQITVFDPTTGQVEDLQTVINNLYDTGRTEALTATEYDGLELTATAYDAYALTATEYDNAGKTLLV